MTDKTGGPAFPLKGMQTFTGGHQIDSNIFYKHTTYKVTKYGHEISCVKKLWRVCAPTKMEAEREARHYFYQYWLDGEYDN